MQHGETDAHSISWNAVLLIAAVGGVIGGAVGSCIGVACLMVRKQRS